MKEKTIITLVLAALMCMNQVKPNSILSITTDDEFNHEVLQSKQPTLVKFSADWCGVCQGIKRPFEEIAHEKEFNRIKFVEVDIDKHQNLSKEHGVIGIPTFLYVTKGEKKGQDIGIKNMTTFKDDLRTSLRKNLMVAKNEPAETITAKSPQEIIETMNKAQDAQEVKKADVTPEKVADQPQPTPAAPAEEAGILAQLKAMIMMLIEKVKEMITWVIDTVKGWFGK